MKLPFYILILALIMVSCKSSQSPQTPIPAVDGAYMSESVHVMGLSPSDVNVNANYIPKAVIYKTNGNYNNNVTVTLDPSRSALISYPDPLDISSDSAPYILDDGWLLDRRGGIGPNTAFLDYTYSEYSALPRVPSASELLKHVIPGAAVTEYRELPVNINQAFNDPQSLNKYINQ